MNQLAIKNLTNYASQLSCKIPYLKILVLFGSQATAQANDDSDWDFAVLYDEKLYTKQLEKDAWDLLEIPSILGEVFEIDSAHIDVIDLSRCHPFVADSIAIEGKLVYEKADGEFENYRRKIKLSEQQKEEISQQLKSNIDAFLKTWNPS